MSYKLAVYKCVYRNGATVSAIAVKRRLRSVYTGILAIASQLPAAVTANVRRLDSQLSMVSHIAATYQSCFYQMRYLRS